jgi:hypothetical protein
MKDKKYRGLGKNKSSLSEIKIKKDYSEFFITVREIENSR